MLDHSPIYFIWTNSDSTMDNPPIYFIWIDSDSAVDNPPIYFIWINFDSAVDNPSIYFIWTNSDSILLDNHPIKTICSKSCRVLTLDIHNVPMHVKCNAIAYYLLISCMHKSILLTKKLHVIQTKINHAN